MRVYEIARELGLESKFVIKCLQQIGVDVKSHANAITEEDAQRLRNYLETDGESEAGGPTPVGTAPVAEPVVVKPAARTKKKPPQRKVPARPDAAEAPASAAPPAPSEAEQAAAVTAVPGQQVEPGDKGRADAPAAAEAVAEAPAAAPGEEAAAPGEEAAAPGEEAAAPLRTVTVQEGISVRELAERAGLRPADVIRELMQQGVMANVNQSLDVAAASRILQAHGMQASVVSEEEVLLGEIQEGRPEDLQPRAPVVTIMGHVDHGKTQLLDSIRQTNIVAREAGGITQHIGASEVEWKGQRIVFIDTPGHEAFTRMRARGAQVTDIVVLVVAADDGIMPQTVEAIDHARAAGVPIIVAINKIDRPEANVDRVKQQLVEHKLTPEEWGGETICVPVSAKTKENIEDLLEMILLQAELLELKANPKVPARGVVLEAQLDRRRGPVATLLVQEGTLRRGDSLIAGLASAKVRALLDARSRQVDEAPPATAVEVLGFDGVPAAGDHFQVVEEAALARKVAELRQQKQRQESLAGATRLTLADLHERIREGDRVRLAVILKADTQGSVETLRDALTKLSTDSVEVEIIRAAVGGVSENDVLFAAASDAIIVGFNVRPERGVADIAEREKVDLRLYTIIYQLLDDVRQAMVGQLKPTYEEVELGAAEVRDTFRVPRVGTIAGCYVTDGKVTRDARVRLVRDARIVYEGRVSSLRRFKDDVREVVQGYECGIGLDNFNDVKVGDVIEFYEVKEVRPEL